MRGHHLAGQSRVCDLGNNCGETPVLTTQVQGKRFDMPVLGGKDLHDINL
jgi:hypothetical protein